MGSWSEAGQFRSFRVHLLSLYSTIGRLAVTAITDLCDEVTRKVTLADARLNR